MSTKQPSTAAEQSATAEQSTPKVDAIIALLPKLPDSVSQGKYVFNRSKDFYRRSFSEHFESKHLGQFSLIKMIDGRTLYVYLVALIHDFERDADIPYAYVLNEKSGHLMTTPIRLKSSAISEVHSRNAGGNREIRADAPDAADFLNDIAE